MYKYVGRSIVGIYKMKQQNAVIELQSRVIVQNIDQSTIMVKVIESNQSFFFLSNVWTDWVVENHIQMTENWIRRNGNYLVDASDVGGEYPEEIEGEEDQILNPEILSTPFVITHNKGSVS